LHKLELHLGSQGNYQFTRGMSKPPLPPCPRWATRLEAVRLYRDIASVHRNRREFDTQWRGPVRICARRL